jgi:fructose-1-phosphate kinase PfkB-like protein
MDVITLVEMVPAADELWSVKQHETSGYINCENGIIGFNSVANEAKIRPTVKAAYAGGKATNVARILGDLLYQMPEQNRKLKVELLTFLPEADLEYNWPQKIANQSVPNVTPGGHYIMALLCRDIKKGVKLIFETLAKNNGKQVDRRCINISTDGGQEINFSPNLVWSGKQEEKVLDVLYQRARMENVVLSGSLPIDARGNPKTTIYQRIIENLVKNSKTNFVSLDVAGAPLVKCVNSDYQPNLVSINRSEFDKTWVDESGIARNVWAGYKGTLLVHDKNGCWIRENGEKHGPIEKDLSGLEYIKAVKLKNICVTVGAGDAFLAGFLLGRFLYKKGPDRYQKATCFGLAVAAAAVGNPEGTRGIQQNIVQKYYKELLRLSAKGD